MERRTHKIFITSIVASFLLGFAFSVGALAKRIYHVDDFVESQNAYYAGNIKSEAGNIRARKSLTPSDDYYSYQKLYSHGASLIGDIESVWSSYTGEGTTVAVIDDGFDYNHPEYRRSDGTSAILSTSRHYYTKSNRVYYQSYSDDPSCIDEGWDSDNNEWDTHGTNTSTTAAAPINDRGGVGVAPDANILALKVDMSFGALEAAIDYAVSQKVDVINLSLGAYSDDFVDGWGDTQEANYGVDTYLDDVCLDAYDAGVIVIAAAGNESTWHKSYPACNKKVIGVGALEMGDPSTLAAFTNYVSSTQTGEINVDILAPGYVYTAKKKGTKSSPTHGYGSTQGTSFSCPMVAGAACLWKQKHPNGTPSEFLQDLQSTASDIGAYANKMVPVSLWESSLSDVGPSNIACGRLNVASLLEIDEPFVDALTQNINIVVGETKQISLRSVSGTISYSSSNPSTASVSSSGLVTGVGEGETTIVITASKNGHNAYAEISVTVGATVAVSSMGFNPNEVTLNIGDTYDAEATLTVTPANASRVFLFESDDPGVASVDEETGLVTANGAGTARISAVSVYGEGYDILTISVQNAQQFNGTIQFGSGTGRVNVNDTSIDGSDSLSHIWNITTSGTSSFTANPSYSQIGSAKNPASSITFMMNLSEVVTFSNVSASFGGNSDSAADVTIRVGSTTIGTGSVPSSNDVVVSSTSSASGSSLVVALTNIAKGIKAYSISYTYTGSGSSTPTPTVSSVSITPSSLALDLYDNPTGALTATVLGANSPSQEVAWTSSNSQVASVTNGTVTAVAEGQATITATSVFDPSKSDSVTVTVTDSTPKSLSSISISGYRTSFELGDEFVFGGTVTATFSDSSMEDVTNSCYFNGYHMDEIGEQTVTVSYTYGQITKTAQYTIHVNLPSSGDNVFTLGFGEASGKEGTYENFASTSGSVSSMFSFSCAQNNAQNAPAYNGSSHELRLYYASTGNGGSITITPVPGTIITKAVITSSTDPTLGYAIDGGSKTTMAAANNTYSIEGFEVASSLYLQNANTSNTQLRIKTIALTMRQDKVVAGLSASYTGDPLYVGMILNKNDIHVEASYTNSTKYPSEVLPTSYFNVTELDSASSGVKTLTVTYAGPYPTETTPMTTTLEITVLEDVISSVTVTSSKTYHPGDTIVKTDLSMRLNYASGKQVMTDNFSLQEEGYQFLYEDAPSGGSSAQKQFHAVFAGNSYPFNVTVSRLSYVAPALVNNDFTGAQFASAGITGTSASGASDYDSIIVSGVNFALHGAYIYTVSGTKCLSFGKGAGDVYNTSPLTSPISYLSLNFASGSRQDAKLYVSQDGQSFIALASADLSSGNYRYFKVAFETDSSSYSNISSISVKTRCEETLLSVANYIMFTDTENQCLTKLGPAITMLNAMSSADRQSFFESEDYVIATARTRLLAWARSQGQEVRLVDDRVDVSTLSYLSSVSSLSEPSSNVPWLILLSLLGVTTLSAAYFYLRRRFEN